MSGPTSANSWAKDEPRVTTWIGSGSSARTQSQGRKLSKAMAQRKLHSSGAVGTISPDSWEEESSFDAGLPGLHGRVCEQACGLSLMQRGTGWFEQKSGIASSCRPETSPQNIAPGPT